MEVVTTSILERGVTNLIDSELRLLLWTIADGFSPLAYPAAVI